MEKRVLICIGCPMGCPVTVTMDGADVVDVIGNVCPRGKTYAEKEVTNPTRFVTSTVKVEGGNRPFVSVKTKQDIPKEMVFECMKEINRITAKAPIAIGDVILENVAGTGIAIVATKAVAITEI